MIDGVLRQFLNGGHIDVPQHIFEYVESEADLADIEFSLNTFVRLQEDNGEPAICDVAFNELTEAVVRFGDDFLRTYALPQQTQLGDVMTCVYDLIEMRS